MDQLIENLKKYLHDTINVDVEVSLWPQQSSLPYYIIDDFCVYEMKFIDRTVLLLAENGDTHTSAGEIKKYIGRIQEKWAGGIIYVSRIVRNFNRRRLINANVPFIIPDKQIYLAEFGQDLRECVKKSHLKKMDRLSPSSQAIIIYTLLNDESDHPSAGPLSEKLNYSYMSVTRAFLELEKFGIGSCYMAGQTKYWNFPESKSDLWEQAKPFLRSPIKEKVWLRHHTVELLAELNFISHFSNTCSPSVPVYAISYKRWKSLRKLVQKVQSVDEASLQLELWTYDPQLFSKDGNIDPFSMYLSLEDSNDARAELALEELMEKINRRQYDTQERTSLNSC